MGSDVLDNAGPEDIDRRLAFRVDNDVRRDFATKLAQKKLGGYLEYRKYETDADDLVFGGIDEGCSPYPTYHPDDAFSVTQWVERVPSLIPSLSDDRTKVRGHRFDGWMSVGDAGYRGRCRGGSISTKAASCSAPKTPTRTKF